MLKTEIGGRANFGNDLPMYKHLSLTFPVVIAASLITVSARADIISATDATIPIAFFPLQSSGEGSTVNGYATTYNNGATDVPSNGGPQANAVSLNGVNNSTPEYVSTTLSGGINGKGSIDAWVNLASLNGGAIEYIAGESQNGNDFDFQFTTATSSSENLCFYSDAGSSTCATTAIPATSLLNQWVMVTATYDSTASGNNQDVYLNGVLVGSNGNASGASKTNQFNIGYSTIFTNRDLDGLISDVGVWNYQLSATQVADLFAAGSPVTNVPEPASLALFGSALAALAMLRSRKRKTT